MTDRDPAIARGTLQWSLVLAGVDVIVAGMAVALGCRGANLRAVALAWVAASLGAVIVLYVRAAFGANPGAWMKGTRGPWLIPLFAPFRIVAWCVLLASRVTRRGDPRVSHVLPDLALGIRLFDFEVPHALHGLDAVLDLASEMPTSRAPRERMALPVLDRCAPTLVEIDRAAAWVCTRLAGGTGVYIHCAFGRGRSAMMAAAVLLRLGRATTADGALAQVRSARPAVRVKGAQWQALRAYAAYLAEARRARSAPTP